MRPRACLRSLLAATALLAGALRADEAKENTAVYGRAYLRSWTAPAYPKSPAGAYLTGSVSVRVVGGPDGTVTAARSLDATDPALEPPALAAAKRWTFSPALQANQPVASSMDALLVFSAAAQGGRRRPDRGGSARPFPGHRSRAGRLAGHPLPRRPL